MQETSSRSTEPRGEQGGASGRWRRDLRAGPPARADRGGGTGPDAYLGPAVRPRAQGAGDCGQPRACLRTLTPGHRRPREGRRRTRGKEGAKRRPPRGLEGGSFAPLAPPRVSAPQRPRGEFPGWSHNSLHRSAPSAQCYFPGRPGHPRATAQVPTDRVWASPTHETPSAWARDSRSPGSQASPLEGWGPEAAPSPCQ